jgi:DNA-binding CsgD family transcriptional regulator
MQVTKLLAGGYPNKEIARLLGLSPNTVKVLVQQAFQKTGSENRVQLARWYWNRYERVIVARWYWNGYERVIVA